VVKLQDTQAIGGKSAFMGPYGKGLRGNTHMMMMDLNNLQVADWISAWVEKNVPKKSVAVSRK
jgi:hypothetical protein